MNILPYHKYTISTALSFNEAKDRILNNLDVEKVFGDFPSGGANARYDGIALGAKFKLSRKIMYRNSFLPVIHMHVHADEHTTHIDVKMKIHPLVTILFIVVEVLTGLSFLVAGAMPVSVLIFFIVPAIAIFFFNSEAKIDRKFWNEVLEAE